MVRNSMINWFSAIETIEKDHNACVLTCIEGPNQGEKAILNNDMIIWESGKYFSSNLPQLITGQTRTYMHDDNRIFCERISEKKHLVICGAGHVAIAVLNIARMIGFKVTVIDDRPKFADNARRAHADNVICDTFPNALKGITSDENTYFVIVTRGHQHDEECLEIILDYKYGYIGMMGSRGRVQRVKNGLYEAGFSENAIESLHAPIGIHIKAETPEEIAVSIMGEIILEKNTKDAENVIYEDVIAALKANQENNISSVLATIVSRRGSAPRNIGTKMLIMPDGSCIGTIGGGCVEAEVTSRAHYMLASGDLQPMLLTLGTTGDESEDQMGCGGTEEVYLEVIKNEFN